MFYSSGRFVWLVMSDLNAVYQNNITKKITFEMSFEFFNTNFVRKGIGFNQGRLQGWP